MIPSGSFSGAGEGLLAGSTGKDLALVASGNLAHGFTGRAKHRDPANDHDIGLHDDGGHDGGRLGGRSRLRGRGAGQGEVDLGARNAGDDWRVGPVPGVREEDQGSTVVALALQKWDIEGEGKGLKKKGKVTFQGGKKEARFHLRVKDRGLGTLAAHVAAPITGIGVGAVAGGAAPVPGILVIGEPPVALGAGDDGNNPGNAQGSTDVVLDGLEKTG